MGTVIAFPTPEPDPTESPPEQITEDVTEREEQPRSMPDSDSIANFMGTVEDLDTVKGEAFWLRVDHAQRLLASWTGG